MKKQTVLQTEPGNFSELVISELPSLLLGKSLTFKMLTGLDKIKSRDKLLTMKRHEFTVTTEELYNNFVTGLWDNPELVSDNLNLIEGLAGQNIEAIREAFRGGMTVFLVPNLMETLNSLPKEDEVEIRVVSPVTRKTLGVIVNSEVNW